MTEGALFPAAELALREIYLIFNEGYASTSGPNLVRVDLAREAIRLTRALQRVRRDEAEVAGLLALMLLTDARTGPLGELIPLANAAALDQGPNVT